MQLKIYKKSTIFLALIAILDILGIFLLIKFGSLLEMDKFTKGLLYVAFVFVLFLAYSYYEQNTDRNIIRKAVRNGDVAMAYIKSGTYQKTARTIKLKAVNYWKLNVDIYDNDMKKFETTIVEKFTQHQTKIPQGFVFVTYVEGKESDSLIIPNVIISSIPEYKVLVDDYEKALKPKYLNAFVNNGLWIQTYKDSIKAQKEWEKLDKANQ